MKLRWIILVCITVFSCNQGEKKLVIEKEMVSVDSLQAEENLLAEKMVPDTLVIPFTRRLKKGDTLYNFQTLEKIIVKNISAKKNGIIHTDRHRYFTSQVTGGPDCNGTFCIETDYKVVDLCCHRKDTARTFSYGHFGFFSDPDRDGVLDFLELHPVEGEHIYDAVHFRLSFYQLMQKPKVDAESRTETGGQNYFVEFYYPGGLFNNDSLQREWMVVTDLYWPFD